MGNSQSTSEAPTTVEVEIEEPLDRADRAISPLVEAADPAVEVKEPLDLAKHAVSPPVEIEEPLDPADCAVSPLVEATDPSAEVKGSLDLAEHAVPPPVEIKEPLELTDRTVSPLAEATEPSPEAKEPLDLAEHAVPPPVEASHPPSNGTTRLTDPGEVPRTEETPSPAEAGPSSASSHADYLPKTYMTDEEMEAVDGPDLPVWDIFDENPNLKLSEALASWQSVKKSVKIVSATPAEPQSAELVDAESSVSAEAESSVPAEAESCAPAEAESSTPAEAEPPGPAEAEASTSAEAEPPVLVEAESSSTIPPGAGSSPKPRPKHASRLPKTENRGRSTSSRPPSLSEFPKVASTVIPFPGTTSDLASSSSKKRAFPSPPYSIGICIPSKNKDRGKGVNPWDEDTTFIVGVIREEAEQLGYPVRWITEEPSLGPYVDMLFFVGHWPEKILAILKKAAKEDNPQHITPLFLRFAHRTEDHKAIAVAWKRENQWINFRDHMKMYEFKSGMLVREGSMIGFTSGVQ